MYKIYLDSSKRYEKLVRLVKIPDINNVVNKEVPDKNRAVNNNKTADINNIVENNSKVDKTNLVEIELGRKEGDIDLVTSIQELLTEHNLNINDIVEVIPNLGPGSFTGLKSGVTVANIINWLKGKTDIKDLFLPEYGAEPNIQIKKF